MVDPVVWCLNHEDHPLGFLQFINQSFLKNFFRFYITDLLHSLSNALPGLNRNLPPGNPPLGLGTLLLTDEPVERAWGLATPSRTGRTEASAA